jgi:hypothetical protein
LSLAYLALPGVLAEAASNENGGTFKILVVDSNKKWL